MAQREDSTDRVRVMLLCSPETQPHRLTQRRAHTHTHLGNRKSSDIAELLPLTIIKKRWSRSDTVAHFLNSHASCCFDGTVVESVRAEAHQKRPSGLFPINRNCIRHRSKNEECGDHEPHKPKDVETY